MCTQIGTLFKAGVLSCMASRPLRSHHFSRLISWARLIISASLLNTLLLKIFSTTSQLASLRFRRIYSLATTKKLEMLVNFRNHKVVKIKNWANTEHTSHFLPAKLWYFVIEEVVMIFDGLWWYFLPINGWYFHDILIVITVTGTAHVFHLNILGQVDDFYLLIVTISLLQEEEEEEDEEREVEEERSGSIFIF